jgi:hypothetical protein
MVTRVTCVMGAACAHVVPTWVLPRNVVQLGGAADQVDGFALLLFACELDRGLVRKLVVVDPLVFARLSAEVRPVGRVTLRLGSLLDGRGPARASCLVREEEDPCSGCRNGVADDDEYMAHFEVGERPYRHDSDPPALTVEAEP